MRPNKKAERLLEILVVLLLGLIPLLWFKGGKLITGADIDYPLNPILRLSQRQFVWDPVILGRSSALDSSTLFITGTEAVFYLLTGSLIGSEELTFVFWFSLIGMGMLYLMRYFAPGSDLPSVAQRLGSVVFYMLNFYQFYAWEMVRLGEIPALAAIPLLLRPLMIGIKQPSRARSQLPQIAGFSVIASGVGLNVAVLTVFLFIFIAYFAFDLFINRFKGALGKTSFFALFVSIFIGVNAYWFLPLIQFITSLSINTGQALSIFRTFNLLAWTSSPTSLLNVVRQQGDIFWFDGYGGEPYYPFFGPYQSSPVLLGLSVVLPLLAYGAVLAEKKKSLFFATIAIIGTILSQGLHPPFGALFDWLIVNVPSFWVFRAPWQRWAIPTTLAYCVLAGMTLGKIAQTILTKTSNPAHNPARRSRLGISFGAFSFANRRTIVASLILAIVVLQGFYVEPLVTGEMFPQLSDRQVLPYFYYHLSIPSYVYDTSTWLNSQPGIFRVALFPPKRALSYYWGYGGSKDVSLNLITKPVVFTQYGEGYSFPHPRDQMFALFSSLSYSNYTTSSNLLGLMNVHYLIQRNDIWYNFFPDVDSPSFVKQRLDPQSNLLLNQTIGQWDVYSVRDSYPYVYGASYPSVVMGDVNSLASLVGVPSVAPNTVFFTTDQPENSQLLSLIRGSGSPYDLLSFDESPDPGGSGNLTYVLAPQGIAARYYYGWKQLVSTNGNGTSDMMVFSSLADSHYVFPSWSAPEWSALNSTVIYLQSGPHALTINSISDSLGPMSDIIGIWWRTGWVGMGTRQVNMPVTIPPGQLAIVQVGHVATGPLTVVTDQGSNVLTVLDGRQVPVPNLITQGVQPGPISEVFADDNQTSWWSGAGGIRLTDDSVDKVSGQNSLQIALNDPASAEISHTFSSPTKWSKQSFLSFYWEGTGSGNDVRIVAQANGWADYFYHDLTDSQKGWQKVSIGVGDFTKVGSPSWDSISTLKVTFQEGLGPWIGTYHLDDIGLSSSSVTYSFTTSGQNEYVFYLPSPSNGATNPTLRLDSQSVTLLPRDSGTGLRSTGIALQAGVHNATLTGFIGPNPWLMARESTNFQGAIRKPAISFQRIDSTTFRVHVTSSNPFFLVMGEPFDGGWKAYYDDVGWIQAPLTKSIDERYHFVANGFANSWFVDRTGNFDMTLYYLPQSLFDAGLIISILIVIIIPIAAISFPIVRSRLRDRRRNLEDIIRQRQSGPSLVLGKSDET